MVNYKNYISYYDKQSYHAGFQDGYAEGHVDGVLHGEKLYAPKLGKWIVDKDYDILTIMKCSNCGGVAEWLDGGSQFLSNFCPNCGADMRG